MCGIAGYFALRPVPAAVTRQMHAALARRGPDAAHALGWGGGEQRIQRAPRDEPADDWVEALLHTRLSIIDPRPQADQPMQDGSDELFIVYNGEVYDWQDDARRLSDAGHVFRTRSDTEFLLHGYRAWGIEGLLARINGMFAFAIYDRRDRTVVLARDRMGEKPLVYSLIDGELAFGSLVRSVLPFLPASRRGLSPEGIDAYLAHRYVPAPRTIQREIARLPNGHYLRFDLESRASTLHRYWVASGTSPESPWPGSPWLDALDRAVRIRTVADRPVGVFLSGGIDSTVIASRLALQPLPRLRTFTAAFPGSSMDESPIARETADALELPNEAITMPDTLASDFERIVADLDEPFADPSCMPTWYLARAATQQVKVVLVGDGGDELFAGYKRLAKHLRTRWRAGWRLPLPIGSSLRAEGLPHWLAELAMPFEQAYALRFSGLAPEQRRFLQPQARFDRTVWWRMPREVDGDAPREPAAALDRLLAIDLDNYLPEYVLRKSDLCTMAHGLEARAPMLDPSFVRSVLGLPPARRFTRPPKALLAQALSPALPADFMSRPKRGFNPPLAGWLRGELAPRLEGLGERLSGLTSGQLDARACDRLARAYQEGRESLAENLLQLVLLDASLAQLRSIDALRG